MTRYNLSQFAAQGCEHGFTELSYAALEGYASEPYTLIANRSPVVRFRARNTLP